MEGIYHWLVKQGRLKLSADEHEIVLEVDTEGASACVLTQQDALEVAGILTELARSIWERSDQSASFAPSLVMVSESACRWTTDDGDLTLFALPDADDVGLAFSGSGVCRLGVHKVVEVVQILQWLATLSAGSPLAEAAPASVDVAPSTVADTPATQAAPTTTAKLWWKFW